MPIFTLELYSILSSFVILSIPFIDKTVPFNKAYIPGARLDSKMQKERERMENEFKKMREQIVTEKVTENMEKGKKEASIANKTRNK